MKILFFAHTPRDISLTSAHKIFLTNSTPSYVVIDLLLQHGERVYALCVRATQDEGNRVKFFHKTMRKKKKKKEIPCC